MSAVIASPSCSFSSFPYSSFSSRRSSFSCFHGHYASWRQSLSKDNFNRSKNEQVEGVSQKRFPGRGKDERAYLPCDVSRGDAGRSQPQSQTSVFKSIGAQRDRGVVYDLKEPQVNDIGNIQDSAFLNAVVKVKLTTKRVDFDTLIAEELILTQDDHNQKFSNSLKPLLKITTQFFFVCSKSSHARVCCYHLIITCLRAKFGVTGRVDCVETFWQFASIFADLHTE